MVYRVHLANSDSTLLTAALLILFRRRRETTIGFVIDQIVRLVSRVATLQRGTLRICCMKDNVARGRYIKVAAVSDRRMEILLGRL